MTAWSPIVIPGVMIAPVPRKTPGSDLHVAVNKRPRRQGRVVADDTVVGHHGIDVEVHMTTEGDVGGDPSTGSEQHAVADAIV